MLLTAHSREKAYYGTRNLWTNLCIIPQPRAHSVLQPSTRYFFANQIPSMCYILLERIRLPGLSVAVQ